MSHSRDVRIKSITLLATLLVGTSIGLAGLVSNANATPEPVDVTTAAKAKNLTVSPMRGLRACHKHDARTRVQKKKMAAAIRVARVAGKQPNLAGFRARCGRALIVSGTGTAKRPVVRAMKRAEKQTGLKTRWRSVPNTRKELRSDLRHVAKDPRIGWVAIPVSGVRLELGTDDQELRAMTRQAQRAELGITVRNFRLRPLTWDEPASS